MAGTDKFARFGLSPVAAAEVGAPLIDECIAALECRAVDTRFVPRYNFFVLEVVRAWIDPAKKNAATIHHRGHGHFAASGPVFNLASRMK